MILASPPWDRLIGLWPCRACQALGSAGGVLCLSSPEMQAGLFAAASVVWKVLMWLVLFFLICLVQFTSKTIWT